MQLCSLSGSLLSASRGLRGWPNVTCRATCGPRNRGIHHHGRLKLSDGWFQGELFNQEQCFVGCLRLRYDAQRQVLISQCRPQHGDWGPETTAASHSSKLNQNDSSETRYVVMATLLCTGLVLLQDLTWRNSMRPLFVAIGLEDVADDIERWTKDCWSTVRKLSRGVS